MWICMYKCFPVRDCVCVSFLGCSIMNSRRRWIWFNRTHPKSQTQRAQMDYKKHWTRTCSIVMHVAEHNMRMWHELASIVRRHTYHVHHWPDTYRCKDVEHLLALSDTWLAENGSVHFHKHLLLLLLSRIVIDIQIDIYDLGSTPRKALRTLWANIYVCIGPDFAVLDPSERRALTVWKGNSPRTLCL